VDARPPDVYVDEDALARLRELDRRYSLVILPSHRSYLDGWVLLLARLTLPVLVMTGTEDTVVLSGPSRPASASPGRPVAPRPHPHC
jgi:alpha-beta hydrolase superfamily lysophospholipase